MTKAKWFVAITLLWCSLPLFALNNRSAVSINGLDTNPCTVASPCRSFSTAMLVTTDKGEIVALDTAGYGPFTIAQNVTVSGATGIHAAITATSGNGITINGGSRVYVQNLYILGGGTGGIGIAEGGALRVFISNCFIQGFVGAGIQGTVAAVFVDHSYIADNGAGIDFAPSSGSVDHCQILQNITGVHVGTSVAGSSIIEVTLNDLAIRYSTVGVAVDAPNGGKSVVCNIEHSSITQNNNGLHLTATPGTIVVNLTHNFIEHADGSGAYTANTAGTNTIISNTLALTAMPLL